MLAGFSLFRLLRPHWECLEVFPNAIVTTMGAGDIHKSRADGLVAQLKAVARHTGWPSPTIIEKLKPIGYGSSHDRFDAYQAAWVASLVETEREPIGDLATDRIWLPRVVYD
jgi:hypothetical protein